MKSFFLLALLGISSLISAEENTTDKITQKENILEGIRYPLNSKSYEEFYNKMQEAQSVDRTICYSLAGLIGGYLLWTSFDFHKRSIQYANETVLQDFLSSAFPSHHVNVQNGVISVQDKINLKRILWLGLGTYLTAASIEHFFFTKHPEKTKNTDNKESTENIQSQ